MDTAARGPEGYARSHTHPDKVRSVRAHAPDAAQVETMAALFKLLGDPTRCRLLFALQQAGELCVCDLAESTAITETTVSQALRLMRAAGVVAGRREGRNVFYRLSDEHVRMLLEVTREHVGHPVDEETPAASRSSR